MLNFDFENWDFLDPKIVSKFKMISDVSQMLLSQQDQLKNTKSMSFKDKQKVQNNINRFKENLESLVSSQKDNFIDYFDDQVNAVSKGVNVPQLSRTFRESLRIQNSSQPEVKSDQKSLIRHHGRRYSAEDLTSYLKEKEMKDKVLEELKSSRMQNDRDILTSSILRERDICHEENSRLYESKNTSRLHLGDLDSHRDFKSRTNAQSKVLKNRPRTDSIFSEVLEDHDTQAESYHYEKKVRELQEELNKVKQESSHFKKLYYSQKNRALKENPRRRKNFVNDRKKRTKDLSYKCQKVELELELTSGNDIELQEEVNNLREQNENLRQGLREVGKLVIRNEDMIQEILRNKNDIEKECKLSKELNTVLLENFANFKKYVEKTFGNISNRLATYVQKEEYYSEIVKENEQLKQKCKALLMKLKEMAEL